MNGNPLFSRKDIAKILLPLVLQNILTITIGMVDSIMVSGTAAQDVTTYGFTYDENGNITEICDSEGSVQRKYYYDELGQLVREDNRALGKTYVWTYDNAGNIEKDLCIHHGNPWKCTGNSKLYLRRVG